MELIKEKLIMIDNWFRGVTDSTNDFGSFSQGSNPCGTFQFNL